ncbi:hypothetical protein MMC26_002598 [Xylographa opegraphella]|nr:hypothetical protein [Xylographa opegraphella]
MDSHKSSIRQRVWSELKGFAYADSRFDFDFTKFITDFQGSSEATQRLTRMPSYQSAQYVFITPDNCLEQLRYEALANGKLVLMTTYAIRRGFWLLDPSRIDPSKYWYASTLDGMERIGQPISLSDMMNRRLKIDLMVTGTGAINLDGIRFGKGHGFFDLEWAMLYSIGAISSITPSAAIVHDCQVLTEPLVPELFDTVCDVVITPTKLIEVSNANKPTCGILWEKLASERVTSIPPLQELRALIDDDKVIQPDP